jgi:archaellin
MRSNRVGTAIVAIACVVLVAACGSSGGSKGASNGAASSSAPTTAKPNPAADRARAQALLLTMTDLPAGWAGTKSVEDPDDKAENQKLADCTGAFDPANDIVNIEGDDFDKGTNEISSSASVVDTRDHFVADVKAIKSDKVLSCFQSIFSEDLPKALAKDNPGVTVHDLKVSRVSTGETYGEVTVGFRVSVTIAGPAGSIPLYIDEYELGSGRDEVSVMFDSQGAPFADTLERSVLATAGGKLTKTSA